MQVRIAVEDVILDLLREGAMTIDQIFCKINRSCRHKKISEERLKKALETTGKEGKTRFRSGVYELAV
jgi:hypothetical protein